MGWGGAVRHIAASNQSVLREGEDMQCIEAPWCSQARQLVFKCAALA